MEPYDGGEVGESMKAKQFTEKIDKGHGMLSDDIKGLWADEVPCELLSLINKMFEEKIHMAICIGYWHAASDVNDLLNKPNFLRKISKWSEQSIDEINDIINFEI